MCKQIEWPSDVQLSEKIQEANPLQQTKNSPKINYNPSRRS